MAAQKPDRRQLSPAICAVVAAATLIGQALIAEEAANSVAQTVEQWAGGLSDTTALGQLFMLGYQGVAPPDYLLDWVTTGRVGGIKIFTRNVTDLDQLQTTIQQLRLLAAPTADSPPLVVATDQEGGWIRHIKHETSTSAGNLSLGAGSLPHDAYYTGLYLGSELSALGINMNFAPTIDLYTDPDATVIGPRAFSSDPTTTGLLAVAYYQGLQSAGVIATAKHFPGHGATSGDSHGSLPVVDVTEEQLLTRELVPYRMLIREGLPAIMSGHLAFPLITDGQLTPASMSPHFQRTLLRTRLGFEGVIITDDMEMGGALAGAPDPATAVVTAIQAGNDIVLIAHSAYWQGRAWEAARRLMETDQAFRETVYESARRVLRMKAQQQEWLTVGIAQSVPAPGATEFFFESAARGVTVIADRDIPLRVNAGMRVLMVGQLPAFFTVGSDRMPGAAELRYPYSPFYRAREPYLSQLPRAAADYDLVVFGLSNYNSLQVLERMEALSDKLVVMSALTPVYLRSVPWVKTAIAVYGTDEASFRAGFGALLGDFEPTGRLPLSFD